MKYHGYLITKHYEDLGEDNPNLNYLYTITKDGEFKAEAINLSSAKTYIDSGENESYL